MEPYIRRKDHEGYDQWQVADDNGSQSDSVRDQIHTVGGQIGLAIVPSNFKINCKYMDEYNAVDRFEGDWSTSVSQ